MHSRLHEAAAHLKAGRDREAAAACEEALASGAPDAATLHLKGVALKRLGDAAGARAAFEAALAIDPSNAPARFQLGAVCQAQGDLVAAQAAFARLVADNPLDYEAAQRCVDCIAARARDDGTAGQSPDRSPPAFASVAIGFCSVDEAKEHRARESLARALAPSACTFHVIRDARSLSEGFNRILDAARADLVILCHDDIEVWTPRLDRAIDRALRDAEIAGVAGANLVTGPAVLWTGHPHVHGGVVYPRGDSLWEAAPLSLSTGVLAGMQAIDGVFMALTPKAARDMRFDAEAFDGFHFYDLDFTYRAHLAGYKLSVTTEICLVHASEGDFGDSWKRYAQRFAEKFPSLTGAAGAPHWYGARFDTRQQVLAFHRRLHESAPAP